MSNFTYKKTNKDFMVLSAICIIFVVDAHSGSGLNILTKIFPYDSFFMPAFIFISGYFYKDITGGKALFDFIIKKSKNLLIPYYKYNIGIALIWIVVSLIVNKKLLNTDFNGLFETEDPCKSIIKTMFLNPFNTGVSFDLTSPTWFLISLFSTIISFTAIKYIIKNKSLFF
mgnify:FL=1